MDRSRLSIAATGAYHHPLGDQTPIDCRYSEVIESPDLPERRLLYVSAETLVEFGAIANPRAVIVWNVSGAGLQAIPTSAEAAAIAAKVLQVALVSGEALAPGVGWLELRPAKPGQAQGGSQILWLAAGTRVVLRPKSAGEKVCARVLILPGPSDQA